MLFGMSTKIHTIEVDEPTATALQERADERGLTVADLLAEFAGAERAPLDIDDDQIAELDRRWLAVQAGSATVPHDRVVRWLETWGTPAFKPWRDQ
jgi:predicted transcriptional regulator